MSILRNMVFTTLWVIVGPWALAQPELDLNPLTTEAHLSADRLAPGAIVPLEISLNLSKEFYVYVSSLELKGTYPVGIEFDDLKVEPQVEFYDSISQGMKMGVKGTGTIHTLLKVPDSASPAKAEVQFRLRYQACTESFCLFPKWIDISVPVRWVSADSFYETDSIETQGHKEIRTSLLSQDWRDVEAAFKNNLYLALALLFLFGLLTSLTPCVYPMIPITLAVLGVQGDQRTWIQRLLLSVSYVVGIATIYTTLGIFAAMTGSLFGSYLGHPVVIVTLAILFLILGLSSWGLFELDLSKFLQPKGPQSKGLWQAYITGLFAGFLAGPCVGPVLFGVLAYIAQSKDVTLGAISLLTYSLGFGVLFVALGLFAGFRKWLPASGAWTEWIKKIFGLAFLALSLYYLFPLLPRPWLFLLGGLLSLLLAATMKKPSKAQFGTQVAQTFGRLIFVGVGVGCTVVAFQLWFTKKPDLGPGLGPEASYEQSQLDAALAEGKPILIDFYADWCFACVEINNKVFPNPTVRERMSRMAVFKVDLTRSSSQYKDLLDKYNIQSLPTLIFLDSKGQWREDLTLRQFEQPEAFVERLDKILNEP